MRRPGIVNGSRTNQAFEFIKAEIARTGRFPSDNDIRDHMGWRGTSGVNDTLLRLVEQGRLRRVAPHPGSRSKRPRSYEVSA